VTALSIQSLCSFHQARTASLRLATDTSTRCWSSEDAKAAAEAELRQGGVAEHREGVEGEEAEVGDGHGLGHGDGEEVPAGERAVAGEADGEQAGHPALVLDEDVVEVGGHGAQERGPRRRRRVAVGRRPAAVAGEVVLDHRLVHEADVVAPSGALLEGARGHERGV
jgi:hypothetical protein